MEWAKTILITEVKKEILICEDREGRKACYSAAFEDKLELMQKIWQWAKEVLTTEEISNEMLLRTAITGRNAWHNAAYEGELNITQKIWE